ncbi:MAG: DUF5107 domain-containing protein [Bradyrhizobium sp.]|nr:DUF5107 domain-containing protein [Bradyrhizobium sp.]
MAIKSTLPGSVRFVVAMLSAACALPSLAGAASAPPDHVSLRESTIAWSTLKYSTDAEGGLVSLDAATLVDRPFKTYVIENRYLKVTLLPEFGGRILSLIYKPTGHEELFRDEVGVPYGIKQGTFYYDWMMVYGGIFPTFPNAEHGKTWLKSWDFRIVQESEAEVTVSMSFRDDVAFAAAPRQFRRGSTGIEATYYVTLKAGRAALDGRVVLKNPQDEAIDYEYWTCTTLAPGSDPEHPKATGGAEIIAPIAAYSTPRWYAKLAEGDASTGADWHRFDKLRYFKNWPTLGIAYAAPDMQGGNFWGVINHDNEEGIIRIADNALTRGLKMWTWGFPSLADEADASKQPSPAQPYVELWAGVSDQFFHSASLPAHGEVAIPEAYGPTVGMSDVTDANEHILVNLAADASNANLQFVSLEPETPLHVRLKRGEAVLFDEAVSADPRRGNRISVPIDAGGSGEWVQATISAADGSELISAETRMK